MRRRVVVGGAIGVVVVAGAGAAAAVATGTLGSHGIAADSPPALAGIRAVIADQAEPGLRFGSTTTLSPPPSVHDVAAHLASDVADHRRGQVPAGPDGSPEASHLMSFADQQAASTAVLGAAFTPTLAAQLYQRGDARDLVAEREDPTTIDDAGSGVSSVHVTQASMRGSTATVTVSAHEWGVIAGRSGSHWKISVPHNTWTYRVTLVRQGTGWRASRLDLTSGTV